MRHATAPVRRTLRTGFTLVEMLVVMALIVLLAALAAGVANSGLIGSQRLSSGSNAISGWLLIAKQTAARDGAPRGVRFFGKLAPGNPNVLNDPSNTFLAFTSAQYIQSADPVVFNPAQEGNPTGPCLVFNVEYNAMTPTAPPTKRLYFVTLSATPTDVAAVPPRPQVMSDLYQRVAAGDSLVLPEYGISTKLLADPQPYNGSLGQLVVDGAQVPLNQCAELFVTTLPDFAAAGQAQPATVPATGRQTTIKTYKFGFQNVPRPVLGESPLLVTGDIGIDYRGNVNAAPPAYPAPHPPLPYPALSASNPTTTLGVDVYLVNPANAAEGYYFDILFAPSGRVLGNTNALTCLWVRDLTKIDGTTAPAGGNPRAYPDAAGEQLLTVIYNRSGLIATQPVAPEPDPYQFAKDGANNGV